MAAEGEADELRMATVVVEGKGSSIFEAIQKINACSFASRREEEFLKMSAISNN